MAKTTSHSDPIAAPLEPLLDALADAVALRVADRINARPPADAPAAAPPLVTTQEWLPPFAAAERLHVSPKTLEAWRSRGEGPPFGRAGSRIRYNTRDLDAWARTAGAR
jgi:hypothetical protein